MRAILMQLLALALLFSAADMLLPEGSGRGGVRFIGAIMTAQVMLRLVLSLGRMAGFME